MRMDFLDEVAMHIARYMMSLWPLARSYWVNLKEKYSTLNSIEIFKSLKRLIKMSKESYLKYLISK